MRKLFDSFHVHLITDGQSFQILHKTEIFKTDHKLIFKRQNLFLKQPGTVVSVNVTQTEGTFIFVGRDFSCGFDFP